MKSAEIRDAFLKFFESKGHTIVPSSSLIPGNDPTLLFTNAGMVPFKDVFLGDEKRPYSRAVSSQRCVRAGGKHNDLENVGYTARHHTFFEMLGNFSFGDYFKRDAILFAWEFLTAPHSLNIPTEKLWVTIYAEDDEAFDIWHKEVGLASERIIRIGDNKGGKYNSDNFWAMGDTGPCGPSSEIFYDHGADVAGGLPGTPEEDGDRYIEIWNLVFMQFNRMADGTMKALPKPSVDTGMGLERISAVMQQVHSNYEIDLFQSLLKATADVTQCSDMANQSLRVIADHIRSCAFLIIDGVMPSNEGRGYVLRRIMRRAIRHGNKLGQQKPFFHKLAAALADEMGDAYPELRAKGAQITKAILAEEEQFAKTLDKGLSVLESALESMAGDTIDGDTVFTLYDTYGFPVDLTADIARERGLQLDMDGYESAMDAQRQRARAAGSFKVDYSASLQLDGQTEFTGYRDLQSNCRVVALLKEGESVNQLSAGDRAVIVLEQTPFYAESGGQVGDTGYLRAPGMTFEVQDCTKQGGHHLHIGVLHEGSVSVGDNLHGEVDPDVRQATALNHSATHLLHAALRQVLGEHVTQKGSLVDAERLRFDFSHPEAVQPAQLKIIEQLVNAQVRLNSDVTTDVCDMETAKAKGAMALFGEKYGDSVRVLTMGAGFSVELCGGTHVQRTGEIGLFRIVAETGIASGVRRIEAVTGAAALAQVEHQTDLIVNLAGLLKTGADQVQEKTEQLLNSHKTLEKELAAAKAKLATLASGDLISQAVDVQGLKLLAVQLEGVDSKSLRDTVDQLKNKLGTAVVLLATVEGDKVALVAGVTKDATARVKAGDLMRHAAGLLGGKGGGRPDMAQGGGSDVAALPAMLASIPEWLAQQLR
ncbi:alanine--tRNA ligase [Simiduia aestuariiviva]|uniref:Alanine--tRNA ligase n=1 Tax=Simiduia aestuariiviva TaxID=1510459 RepID=A0A839UIU9_9GAMM|nr:alanine--tRNA ligase [Simiduia aestuariiviva]MBB3168014.1 alanyl-tRNA synthetase [Simiduia aestuariiviva]